MKKFLATLLAAMVAVSSAIAVAGCNVVQEKVDTNKTQLYVALYEGGVGRTWLDNSIKRFETEYADYEFEPGSGKKGAQIIVSYSKSYDSISLITSLPTNSSDQIIFTNGGNYFDFVPYLYDISDIINEANPDDNNKTIASKLGQDVLDYHTVNGGVYALPNWELYTYPTYDAGVFEQKKLYFSDAEDVADTTWPGTKRFVVNAQTKKSCGPDGIPGTYDDGMPSSFAELYKLMDKMVKNSVTPFVFTGTPTYTNQIFRAMIGAAAGADVINAFVNFNSNGNPVEVVTGFDESGNPQIDNVVLTKDNAYLAKQSAGLYYTIEFAQALLSNQSNFYKDSMLSAFSYLDAMEAFLNSGLDGASDYIGMIIDGNHWYNESTDDGQFERLQYDYPNTYMNKDFRIMPLPSQRYGSVSEGQGKSPVVYKGSTGKLFVNNKIEDNKIEIMTKFVQFLYRDSELLEFTKDTNGIFKGVDYDYSTIMEGLNPFAQSTLKMRDAAIAGGTYVMNLSNEKAFVNNLAALSIGTNEFWVSGGAMPVDTFHYLRDSNKETARQFFSGMGIHKDTWTNMMNA